MSSAGPPRLRRLLEEMAGLSIIDAHQHSGSWGSFGRVATTEDPSSEPDFGARVDFMRDWGIHAAVIHPNPQVGGDTGAIERANRAALEAHLRLPEAFPAALASISISPEADIESSFAELEAGGFSGLTFHHRFIGRPLDHPGMDSMCELAAPRNWPIAVHCLAESTLSALWRLGGLASRFSHVQFLALAALSSPSQTQFAIEFAKAHENVAFDTTLMGSVPGMVHEFCMRVSPERLVYGSDLYMRPRPIYDIPSGIVEVLASPISKSDKDLIFSGNATRLFHLGQKDPADRKDYKNAFGLGEPP